MDLSENITGLHHYALKVIDFEKTLKFYAALGFEVLHPGLYLPFNWKKD